MKTIQEVTMLAGALALLLASQTATANKKESEYVKEFCRGQINAPLGDRTRVDCLTDTTAFEFDFASKWAESIGQALHYSRMTNKAPGVVLIIRKPYDCNHLYKVQKIKQAYLPQLTIEYIGHCNPFLSKTTR